MRCRGMINLNRVFLNFFFTKMFQVLLLPVYLSFHFALAYPMPGNTFPDCSSSYKGSLILGNGDSNLSWGWENNQSCKKYNPQASETNQKPPSELDAMANELLNLVNQHRKGIGRGTLKLNDLLNKAAQGHSSIQAEFKTMTHKFPGLPSASGRITAFGYNLLGNVRENVAWNQRSVQEVFQAWMISPGHRANIEAADITEMGFGYADSSNGPYWTQVFARPGPG